MHRFLALLVLAATVVACTATASVVEPISLNETVRRADSIVVGTVKARSTRWGDASQRFMWTDYTLAVEDVVYTTEALPEKVILTYWGGTIGTQTQAVSDMRVPEIGERLLVMLRPGWNREPGFTPTVGFHEGLFVVDPQTSAVVAAASGAPAGDLATFTAWLRANVASIKASPAEVRPSPDPKDPRLLKTFASKPEPGTTTTKNPVDVVEPLRAPSSLSAVGVPRFDAAAQSAAPHSITPTSSAASANVSGRPVRPEYSRTLYANFPIVVNQYPSSFAPWSPEDQYMMSAWNYYADVFRVYVTPTGTYGWPNGRWDLGGWPSDADLQYVYGTPWPANVLGITFRSYSGNTINEADILLNPAYGWTLDDEWIQSGSYAYGFHQTMSHELGHMHGNDHDFTSLSLMNYLPGRFRYFGIPYMDDAVGIRAGYPGRTVAVTDLGVNLYQAVGTKNASYLYFTPTVRPGEREALFISNFRVENVGTTTINAPTVAWFLTSQRNFNWSYYYLGEITYPALAPGAAHSNISQSMTVPSNVPPGWYYIAAYIPNDGGAYQGSYPYSNNYAFSHFPVEVFQCPDIWIVAFDPFCAGNSVRLYTSYLENATYAWTGPNGFTSTEANPLVNVTAASGGVYTVNISYRDCSLTASKVLLVNPPPAYVGATATAATSVDLTWDPAECAASYDVYRNAGSGFSKIGSSPVPSYTDTTAAANTAYLYAIASVDSGGNVSMLSEPDLATTVVFTDPNLTAGVTPVKAAHIRELRTATAAVRQLAGLTAPTFTDPTLTAGVTQCKAAHISELRTQLDAARNALGLMFIYYDDPSIDAGSTAIRATQVDELRNGVQ